MKQCEQCKKDLKTKEQIKLKVLISGLNPIFCSWECLSFYCGVMLNIEDGFDEKSVLTQSKEDVNKEKKY